jgi:hypothetical protein
VQKREVQKKDTKRRIQGAADNDEGRKGQEEKRWMNIMKEEKKMNRCIFLWLFYCAVSS